MHKYVQDLRAVFFENLKGQDFLPFKDLAAHLTRVFDRSVNDGYPEVIKLKDVKLLEGNSLESVNKIIKKELEDVLFKELGVEGMISVLAYTDRTEELFSFLHENIHARKPEFSQQEVQSIHDYFAIKAASDMLNHRRPSDYDRLYHPDYLGYDHELIYQGYRDSLKQELFYFADVRLVIQKLSEELNVCLKDLAGRGSSDVIEEGGVIRTSTGELETNVEYTAKDRLELMLKVVQDITKMIVELPKEVLPEKLKTNFISPLQHQIAELSQDKLQVKPIQEQSQVDIEKSVDNYFLKNHLKIDQDSKRISENADSQKFISGPAQGLSNNF